MGRVEGVGQWLQAAKRWALVGRSLDPTSAKAL